MKYLAIPLRLVWRLWFYILMFSTLILLSPIFLVVTSREKYYPSFWKVYRGWSFFLIYAMGFRLKIDREEHIKPNQSYMFCANHASYLDGFLIAVMSKNPIVFVGKEEMSKIPIFGYFYSKVLITVNRSSVESRKKVYHQAKNRLDKGMSICIFPEGKVPEEYVVLAPFKNGAFNLAIEYQIPIVLQTYFDGKRFFSWDFFKGRPGLLRIKQFTFLRTKGLTLDDRNSLKKQAFDILNNSLLNDRKYMEDTLKSETKK